MAQIDRRLALLAVGLAGLVLAAIAVTIGAGGGLMADDLPPRTAQLFGGAPRDVQVAAAEIERGGVPTPDQLAAIEDLDARYGDDITLFWHALATGNVPAVEALVKAGASMYQRAKTDKGFYFYEIMAQPGGEVIGPEGIQDLVRIYLENGGDPNATWTYPGSSEESVLAPAFVTYGNLEGVEQLLRAGADPWMKEQSNGKASVNLMMSLASSTEMEALALLDRLIDAGWFDERPLDDIRDVIRSLSGYAQRGDDISLEKQRLGMRILKRHPEYTETGPASVGAGRLFRDHYEDEGYAEIPWDRILSDEIK